jgi:hypothetical protein
MISPHSFFTFNARFKLGLFEINLVSFEQNMGACNTPKINTFI